MLRKNLAIFCLAAVALSSTAHGQAFQVGSEFQANTQANTVPPMPVVAAGPSGDFFVVWASNLQDGWLEGIFARRFDSAGSALGGEFQVNASTIGAQTNPAVAASANGFVVTWSSAVGVVPALFARRFSGSGSALGGEFRVDSYSLGSGPTDPDVAADPSGNFLIVWTDFGINARRFNSAGSPLGSQFRITPAITLDNSQPDLAADGLGNFVAVWLVIDEAIAGRRLAGDGTPLGSEFTVATVPYVGDGPAIELDHPVVAADATGAFVVAWERYHEAGSDYGISRSDIFARGFDSTGAPVGGDFRITRTLDYYYNPAITAVASGEFVVVWDGYQYDDSDVNVYAQRLDAAAEPIGEIFRINGMLADYQSTPSIATSGESDFVVVWSDYTQPAFSPDVRGQRFTTKATTAVCNQGGVAGEAFVKLSRLGGPSGDESLQMKGAFLFPPGTPAVFDPANAGAQILVEDLGRGTAIFDLSHLTQAVPGGSGCTAGDGWTTNSSGASHSYKNTSGALPPGCAAGSANGLVSIKLKDRRDRNGEITFKLKAKKANIAPPLGPLRVTIVFGASTIESGAGECGVASFATEQCSASSLTYKCQIRQ